MYEYAYNGTWNVYGDVSHCWKYMWIVVTYEYVLVYIVKVWCYVILNVILCEVGYRSWF